MGLWVRKPAMNNKVLFPEGDETVVQGVPRELKWREVEDALTGYERHFFLLNKGSSWRHKRRTDGVIIAYQEGPFRGYAFYDYGEFDAHRKAYP